MSPSDPFHLWLVCTGSALGVTAVTFWGLGGLVHWWFYVHERADAERWKLQSRWLSPRMTRQAFWLGSGNIFLGALLNGTFVWYVLRGGWSQLSLDWHAHSPAYLAVSALLIFFAIDAALYYSHRLLHHRLLFRHLHRWHHRFVSPIIFTTTAVHPGEMVIFKLMILIPAFIIPTHIAVYFAVLAYTYLIGMIDHVGARVRWRLPLHSDNAFHDNHHVYFHCNFGHHTALFDRLHGTAHRADRHYDEHTYGGRGAAPPADPDRALRAASR
jgi:lathosterol oxidase